MPVIASLQNPTIKLVRSLREKKHRAETGLFVAEGSKVLARAREGGWKPEYVFVREGVDCEAASPPAMTITEKVMTSLSVQGNPPDAIGVFRQRVATEAPAFSAQDLWVALDAIRDPGNLGTILRTAEAAGASGVILLGASCDPFSPECVRASTGSIFAVPLVRLTEDGFARAAEGWTGEVVATSMTGAHDFRRTYRPPVLLLMGSEGRGLSPALAAFASTSVRIPMASGTESLNVAIATALMLYEIRRTRLT
ncbi:MAG: TrmH family RNA methyltransferase [Hyphomicrobiales bacterium]